jgi:hypothetical protein
MKNTIEARRSLYAPAESALIEQLRGKNPPAAEDAIARHYGANATSARGEAELTVNGEM